MSSQRTRFARAGQTAAGFQLRCLAAGLAQSGAGVMFTPEGEGLELTIRKLRDDYARYQSRTHGYMERYFSPAKHLALHRQLYETLADGVAPVPLPLSPRRALARAVAPHHRDLRTAASTPSATGSTIDHGWALRTHLATDIR